LRAGIPGTHPFRPDDADPAFPAAATPESYRPHRDIPRNLVHFLDRGSLIALDAALQAVERSGLAAAGDSRRFAVSDGLAFRAPGQSTMFVPYGHAIARVLGVRGVVRILAGGETSGIAAIAEGARLIARGEADAVVAGAAQALQRPILEHFATNGASPDGVARPFDSAHNGLVPAEAAAYIVIEPERLARERGANIFGRIVGAGDVFDSATEPLELAGAPEQGRAMQAALAEAGYLQNQVDLFLSCADGRPTADFADGYAALRTFGRHAYYAGVTALAGTTGFALSASGPLSVVAALEGFVRQESFPIGGLQTPEPGVELSFIREARPEKLDCILVTSMAVGGSCAALLLSRE